MVKATSRKQRGIQQNVQKHKITQHGQPSATFFSAGTSKKIGILAAKRWNNIIQTTSRWFLIPIELEEGSEVAKLAPLWKRLVHYTVAVVYFIIMMYKLILTLHRAFYVKLDLIAYMCACSFIVTFIPAQAMVSITFMHDEFCAVLNSWKPILHVVERKTGKKESVFDDITVSLEIGGLVVIIYSAAINVALYSLVVDIPTCVLLTLENTGFVETSSLLPTIVWRLLFLPLEILTLLPPMLVVGVATMTLCLTIGMLSLYAEEARNIKIRNIRTWKDVYGMYRTIQVYNTVMMNWMKVVDVSIPFGACCGVILTLYVTIRPSNIPMIIYLCFPLIAVLTMTVQTRWLIDAILTKSKADQVKDNLQMMMYSQHMRYVDPIEKKICIRRIKSLRPVSLRVGEFAEASLEVALNVWDETFSVLLVLLSL